MENLPVMWRMDGVTSPLHQLSQRLNLSLFKRGPQNSSKIVLSPRPKLQLGFLEAWNRTSRAPQILHTDFRICQATSLMLDLSSFEQTRPSPNDKVHVGIICERDIVRLPVSTRQQSSVMKMRRRVESNSQS